MRVVLLWLRAKDSIAPASIPKSWNILHIPIVEIIERTKANIPGHNSILFTSKRSPIIISEIIKYRMPALCVGSATLAVAKKLGWTKSILQAESAIVLQNLIGKIRIPSPLLYVHGLPISIDSKILLENYSGTFNSYSCYYQKPIYKDWKTIISKINPNNKLFIPILSINTALLWRNATVNINFKNLEIIYFCFSNKIASSLGKKGKYETIHISKYPILAVLIDSMIELTK